MRLASQLVSPLSVPPRSRFGAPAPHGDCAQAHALLLDSRENRLSQQPVENDRAETHPVDLRAEGDGRDALVHSQARERAFGDLAHRRVILKGGYRLAHADDARRTTGPVDTVMAPAKGRNRHRALNELKAVAVAIAIDSDVGLTPSPRVVLLLRRGKRQHGEVPCHDLPAAATYLQWRTQVIPAHQSGVSRRLLRREMGDEPAIAERGNVAINDEDRAEGAALLNDLARSPVPILIAAERSASGDRTPATPRARTSDGAGKDPA